MGTDKSFLPYNNHDFISVVVNHAEKISDHLIIISGKHNYSLFDKKNQLVISDESSGIGPMMGIITGLKNVKTDWVLVLSVDTPFFTSKMMRKLWENKGKNEGVIFSDNEGIHPLNAIYKTNTLKAWEAAFNRGERKLKEVLKQLDIRYLPLSEKESLTLRNINTKAEYCEYILENEIGN
jgi:molybdopterin-guanine dinucleotide biosynthesis protein A